MKITKTIQSAIQHKSLFILKQYPEPLPSALGTHKVLPSKGLIVTNSATQKKSVFIRKQHPGPPPNKIGEEDLPGGFKHSNVMTGQKKPLYDLSRGIIQIDDVTVLFDVKA